MEPEKERAVLATAGRIAGRRRARLRTQDHAGNTVFANYGRFFFRGEDPGGIPHRNRKLRFAGLEYICKYLMGGFGQAHGLGIKGVAGRYASQLYGGKDDGKRYEEQGAGRRVLETSGLSRSGGAPRNGGAGPTGATCREQRRREQDVARTGRVDTDLERECSHYRGKRLRGGSG